MVLICKHVPILRAQRSLVEGGKSKGPTSRLRYYRDMTDGRPVLVDRGRATRFQPGEAEVIAAQLNAAHGGGYMIVDEAFAEQAA